MAQSISSSGTYTYSASDTLTITVAGTFDVHDWGGGGSGGNSSGCGCCEQDGEAGGGGNQRHALANSNTAGEQFAMVIGAGGLNISAQAGGTTSFTRVTGSVILAKANGGLSPSQAGGPGPGSTSGEVGISHLGGTPTSSGGAAAASDIFNGNGSSTSTGALTTTGSVPALNGGKGGDGGSTAGTAPGGGGGGGIGSNGTGANGAVGQIVVVFTASGGSVGGPIAQPDFSLPKSVTQVIAYCIGFFGSIFKNVLEAANEMLFRSRPQRIGLIEQVADYDHCVNRDSPMHLRHSDRQLRFAERREPGIKIFLRQVYRGWNRRIKSNARATRHRRHRVRQHRWHHAFSGADLYVWPNALGAVFQPIRLVAMGGERWRRAILRSSRKQRAGAVPKLRDNCRCFGRDGLLQGVGGARQLPNESVRNIDRH